MMSDPFQAAKKALAAGNRALESLRSARDADTFEDSWNLLLSEIEKIWEKTKSAGKRLDPSHFDPWLGQRTAVRKKDPLLVFLHQARNADHHGIEQVDAVKYMSGSVYVSNAEPGWNRNDRLIIGPQGIIEYQGEKPLTQEVMPPEFHLQRILNRGVPYEPPTQHLGQPLKFTDPISVAHLGLQWYERLVNEAEGTFAS